MSHGGERTSRNGAVFRDANEGIRAARAALPLAGDPVPFICECENVRCTAIILVALAEYAAARERRDQFLVASGHRGDGELVSAGEGFDVVRRRGS